MIDDDKPSLDELMHHGVKGQRWGVRKNLEEIGTHAIGAIKQDTAKMNAHTKDYLAVIGKESGKLVSKKEATAALDANKEKFAQKFAPSDGPIKPGKGLSSRQKKILVIGAETAVVVGGIYLLSKYGESKGIAHVPKLPGPHPGSALKIAEYEKLTQNSMSRTWHGNPGFVTAESFARPAFELPKGHTFYRISTAAEKEFRIPPGTYSLSSIEDFNRYVVGFSKEKGGAALHQIKFQSTEAIKVPHLTDVLDTVKEVVSAEKGGSKVSSEEAVRVYKAMSGGGWSGSREQALLSALRSKGFGAIVDEMDAGVIGEKPLVVFSEHFSGKASTPFTEATVKAAAANLTEIGWRK